MHQTVKKLLEQPVVEQRSEEWYEMRNTLITASDFGQALNRGKFGTVKDFYRKKCGYEQITFNATLPALQWGIMYEPVATKLYEKRNNTEVIEFGLIRHPKIHFLGASPDGITPEGVMLEIKCPYSRKIDGKIVDQYYLQMQGQLDVCDLEECDFLECKFTEYLDVDDFNLDWDTTKKLSKDNFEKGIIIQNRITNEYTYSDVGRGRRTLKSWLNEELNKGDEENMNIIYYKLQEYSVQKVKRDKKGFKQTVKELELVWNTILRYKKNKLEYDIEIGKKQVRPRIIRPLFHNDPDSKIS